MSNKPTILLTLLVAVVACVQAQASLRHRLVRPFPRFLPKPQLGVGPRIVGGFEIDVSETPYQVSLQYHHKHVCGGSVLSSKWILTAAHCMNVTLPSSFTVRLGSSKHASGGHVAKVAKIVQHPNYRKNTTDYDYSLLELEDAIAFSKLIQPITLPKQDETVLDGTMTIVSGWGNTQNKAESNSTLRAVNVPTINQEDCDKAYQRFGGVTDRMLCAGYQQGEKDACQGDSGGPLVADGKLVGVVSWGFGCAQADYPGVFSRVAYVRDWVRENSGV